MRLPPTEPDDETVPPETSGSLPATKRLGPLSKGARIDGRYEVLSLLGQGAMGQVYRARDTQAQAGAGDVVAVKILRPAEEGSEDRLRRYFRREVFSLRALRHPNIIRILETGKARIGDDEVYYYTMECLEGTTLNKLHGRQPVSPRWALLCVRDLASGLALAHAQDFVHRDIKPENIFVTGDGRPVLLDFGMVKLLGRDHQSIARSTVAIKGSWSYMAPEQFQHQTADARSDIYSLGGVLLWMLTGLPANATQGASFSGAEFIQALMAPPPTYDVLPHLDAELGTIWWRALAVDPDCRYASVADLAADIDAYLARHDASPVQRLILSAGARPQTLVLDKPIATVGSAPQCELRLPPEFPPVLFRLLRPRDGYLVQPQVEDVHCAGAPIERRALLHGEVIDYGSLRFTYRRDAE